MKRMLSFLEPQIMGVINLNSNSFYKASRVVATEDAIKIAHQMLQDGADILDLGAMSSRPGATISEPSEEWNRLKEPLLEIRKAFPDAIISIDTVHSAVATQVLEAGADMINDISASKIDPKLLDVVAAHQCYYCLMHMQNLPENMQEMPAYDDLVLDILRFFRDKVYDLKNRGIHQLMVDPGFGFGKSIKDNYTLLKRLSVFEILDLPILIGLSRKSMIYKYLDIQPEDSLPASSALHLQALKNGAKILRVHDVKEARHVIQLFSALS